MNVRKRSCGHCGVGERWGDPAEHWGMADETVEPMTEQEETKSALLIGASVRLRGVDNDVARMQQALGAFGFPCTTVVGEATREAILGALRELVAWTRKVGPSAVVVIYYCGHGGRTRILGRDGKPQSPWFSHFVPVDIESGNPCGVTDFELAGILDELTRVTKNVTLILDCCYAAALRDDGEELVKANVSVRWIQEREVMPSEQQQFLHELVERPASLEPEGNPHVVRLVAASSSSTALEGEQPPHRSWGGHFTYELCKALVETKDLRWPWQTIMGLVRERVLLRAPVGWQRPELTGPRLRLPFTLEEERDVGEQSVLTHDASQRPWMRAGRLHGLGVGDRVAVCWLDARRCERVVEARIVEVLDDSARLELDPLEGVGPEVGSKVVVRSVALRKTVRLEGAAAGVGGLRTRLGASLRLLLVDEGPSDFVVTQGADGLLVTGPAWLSRTPRAVTKVGVAELVEDVDGLARATIVLDALTADRTDGQELARAWEAVAWVTEPGAETPRRLVPGETLMEGTRIYVDVRHLEASGMIHVNVLDHDVSGRVWLVNRSEPAGVQVEAGHPRWVGRRPESSTMGMRLAWPSCVPKGIDGEEEILVLVSDRPVDLRPLLEGPRWEPEREQERGEASSGVGSPLRWSLRRIGFRVRASQNG